MKKYEEITQRLKESGVRYWSNDNISEYISEDDWETLLNEATEEAEGFMRALLIDVDTDPNSKGTPRRLAKMYLNEIFNGRYVPRPDPNSFPNDSEQAYGGMVVVRADIKSTCAHHFMPVRGVAYIGIVPSEKVLGLSKYIRLAQHCARRGTLQEQLTIDIANTIQKESGSEDVAVYIEAGHGCVSCRGVNQENSTTQTTVLRGGFMEDLRVREEFYNNIKLQKM